jgi:hypothetical protein
MPFLSIVRSALVVRRRLIQRFSLSTQMRRRCRLGRKRRLVVRNVVARHRGLAGDLTDSSHGSLLTMLMLVAKSAIIADFCRRIKRLAGPDVT